MNCPYYGLFLLFWLAVYCVAVCLDYQFIFNSYSKPSIYYHFGRNKNSNFCIYPLGTIMFSHIWVWSSQESFCGVHVIYTWPCFFVFFSWRSGGTPVLRPHGRFRFPLVFVPQAVVMRAACVWEDSSVYFGCLSMYVYDKMYFFPQMCIFVGS